MEVTAVPASQRARRALCGSVVLALVGAGCASPSASPAPAASPSASVDLSNAIAWIDAPTDPPTPPTPSPPPPRPADARPCSADDVTARFDPGNGAGGHEIIDVQFRNISDSTCVLTGYPQVTATEPGQPDIAGTDGSFFPTDGPANMAPGGYTLLGLETDTNCAARPGGGSGRPLYHHVDIVLPGGDTISLDHPDGFDITCGLHLTQFSVPRPEQPEPRTPVDGLTATLETPPTVEPGGVLIYVVDLTNPTDQPIALSPCPAYIQWTPSPTPVKDIEALNCAPVRAIAGHGTVRFQMHMPIPADTPVGTLMIFWTLTGPGVSAVPSASVNVSFAPRAGHT
jgi:hypothetical protein